MEVYEPAHTDSKCSQSEKAIIYLLLSRNVCRKKSEAWTSGQSKRCCNMDDVKKIEKDIKIARSCTSAKTRSQLTE